MLRSRDTKWRLRDPERTRERLLQAGFREVHRSGFRSASIDTILAATNVTKGALYYHFDGKEDLGYAIVEEIVAKLPQDNWLRPLERVRNSRRREKWFCMCGGARVDGPRRCSGVLEPQNSGTDLLQSPGCAIRFADH